MKRSEENFEFRVSNFKDVWLNRIKYVHKNLSPKTYIIGKQVTIHTVCSFSTFINRKSTTSTYAELELKTRNRKSPQEEW